MANDIGLPGTAVSTAKRAETSISDDNDAADGNDNSESNTFNSGKSISSYENTNLKI